MSKYVGVVSRGIKLPIIKEGDNLQQIVVDSVLNASIGEKFELQDRDVIGITESLVARAQGNYATIDQIAADIENKLGKDKVIGVVFPILSRNRFAILLKGIAKAAKKVRLFLSYPSDEVGNALLSWKDIEKANINPHTKILSLEEYRNLFGYKVHEFTGIDYIEYYKKLIEEQGAECEIIFINDANFALFYPCNAYIAADIHTRKITKKILAKNGVKVLGLDDILTASVNGSGYNEKYGLLGTNKTDENKVKLFPRDSQTLVEGIQKDIFKKTGKTVEVMVYGDGAFKDPQGKIWELADPVVSPFFTQGLKGTPNELKLKLLADDEKYKDLDKTSLGEEIKSLIAKKSKNLVGQMVSEGTTPRQLTDLLGSLCDLTSGSGDKGTPVILIQNYFKNYSED